MFYYFDRKCALKTYYEFCDQEYRQILKHINVRWLSLERAVERILKQHAGLQSYFLSEDAPATGSNSEWSGRKRFFKDSLKKSLKKSFKDPMTEIYVMIFLSVLPTFTTTGLLLQRENPCTYLIHDALNRFLIHLAGRFMPVRTIKSADQLSTINLENHKHPKDIYLGLLTIV